MTTLVDRILALNRQLRESDLPYAFGGALALAFHVEPRATRDIDVNVFVTEDRAREVFEILPDGVTWGEAELAEATARGQVRLFWDDTPVDLFLSTHRFHAEASLTVVEVPFAGTVIPVLGATELAIFKAFFDRTKDWADIEAMIDAGALEVHRALGWLVDLLGTDDHRVHRLRAIAGRSATNPAFDPPTAD